MDKINKIMATTKTRLERSESEIQTSTNQYSEQFTDNDQNKVNWFFNDLARIFGSKFNIAFPTEQSEQDAKDVYGDIIRSFTKDDVVLGRNEIIAQRATGRLQWLDLSEVLPLFDQTQVDDAQLTRLYTEYLNGGVDVCETMKHPDGHLVAKKIRTDWSTGYMQEVSKRLGKSQYLLSTNKKTPEKVFEKTLRAVLLEMKNGASFEKPIAIEDKSNERKNDGKKGYASFVNPFKKG